MKDNFTYLDENKELPMIFNLNTMEAIQNKFGSFEAWANKIMPEDDIEPDIAALKFGLTEAMNEAIDMLNEEKGTDVKPKTVKQMGRILTNIGMEKIGEKIAEAVTDANTDENTGATSQTQEMSEEEKKD